MVDSCGISWLRACWKVDARTTLRTGRNPLRMAVWMSIAVPSPWVSSDISEFLLTSGWSGRFGDDSTMHVDRSPSAREEWLRLPDSRFDNSPSSRLFSRLPEELPGS